MTNVRRDSFRLIVALVASSIGTIAQAAVAPRIVYTLAQQVVSTPENRFGASFTTDDAYVLVGSPFAEDAVGSAQLFRADTGGFERALFDPDETVTDRSFGTGVALLGASAAVGAAGQGVVHLFDTATGALQRSISSPDPGVAGFGARLASAGTILLVGTYSDVAYLIDPATGTVLHTLVNPLTGGSGLGGPVAAAPGIIVLSRSAPAGRVVHVVDPSTGAVLQTLLDPANDAATSGFGASVAIVDGNVLVGAPNASHAPAAAGAAYLFDAATGALLQSFVNPAPSGNDFGGAVAGTLGVVLVGAPEDGGCGVGCGRAFLFDAATGAPLGRVDDPHSDVDVHFGAAAIASSGRVLVQSPGGLGRDGGLVSAFALSCGNGSIEPGEACDDGNAVDGDGCDGNCTMSACGNGAVAPGEACDDGNTNDHDGCTASCVVARCGDGIERAGFEQCDDGNATNGDGCDASCTESLCVGGGVIRGARLDVENLGGPYGDERIVLRGELVLPDGAAAGFAPSRDGLQVELHDATFPVGFGMNGALDFNVLDGAPVPPGARGTLCGAGDGWRSGPGGAEWIYRNASGSIDPPLCTAGSARGLRRVRITDARARGGGIRFRIETLRSTVGDPVTPLLAGIVLGTDRSDAAGRCGLHEFAADQCRIGPRGTGLRCRAGASAHGPR